MLYNTLKEKVIKELLNCLKCKRNKIKDICPPFRIADSNRGMPFNQLKTFFSFNFNDRIHKSIICYCFSFPSFFFFPFVSFFQHWRNFVAIITKMSLKLTKNLIFWKLTEKSKFQELLRHPPLYENNWCQFLCTASHTIGGEVME